MTQLAAAITESSQGHQSKTEIIHGENSPLVAVIRTCSRIAASDATVLVTGETGTGKEVFARLVHERSRRANKNLVSVNCAAIPETLLESELFGYVKGAFTGAAGSRRGRIALAEGGTLFLDEIGELPLSLQVKLLRVLQERVYEPVGSNESVPADFRLVAATNRNLAAEVEAGRFRRDLYYRLMVCPVELPSLRERSVDVVPLFHHFWTRRGETRPLDAAVDRALERYEWPGNVRELENLVERLSVCCEGECIRLADLPAAIRGVSAAPALDASSCAAQEALAVAELSNSESRALRLVLPPPETGAGVPPQFPLDLTAMLRKIEEDYIDAALEQTKGNRKAAAELLGLQRTTLVEKLRRRNRPTPAAGIPAVTAETPAE